jgi:hypothetical protein
LITASNENYRQARLKLMHVVAIHRALKNQSKMKEKAREHIRSFPALESHYSRQKSTKKYLAAGLNRTKMYGLYKEKCAAEKCEPLTEKLYRDIFNNEFNLAFHKPKRDACAYCIRFNSLPESEKPVLQQDYLEHVHRKKEARIVKEKYKNIARTCTETVAVTFDLEKVLQCPAPNVNNASSLYYKRKLSTYNLTVYSLGDAAVKYYMWHEGAGGRGSSEIATCIKSFTTVFLTP